MIKKSNKGLLTILLLPALIFLVASCTKLSIPLTEDQLNEVRTTFIFDDQDPAQGFVRGPITVDFSEEIVSAAQGSRSFDRIDVYMVSDSEVTDFGNLDPVSSTELTDLTTGVNELGELPEGTAYRDDAELLITFYDSSKDKAVLVNPLSTGVSTYVDDYVLVEATDSVVEVAPEVLPIEVNHRLADIRFAFDDATVAPEYISLMESETADYIAAAANMKIYVAGHTDKIGTTEYNLALGQRRANAVKAVLISLGFDPDSIIVASFGEDRPMDPNSNSKNRRAEVLIEMSQ